MRAPACRRIHYLNQFSLSHITPMPAGLHLHPPGAHRLGECAPSLLVFTWPSALDATPVDVYTDSLWSLYLVKRYLYFPNTHQETEHIYLLNAISTTLHTRTQRGAPADLCTVKAHSSCVGYACRRLRCYTCPSWLCS